MIRVFFSMLVCAVLALATGRASADEMAFFIKNKSGQDIALELRGGGGRAWPGGDQVYMIEKKMQKSIPVECEAGERICYGAWVVGDDSVHWGVGPDNTLSCEDCCTTCTKKTTFAIDVAP